MIVGIANQKGGVGKSTLSIAIGSKLGANIVSNDINGLFVDVFDFYTYTDNLNGYKFDDDKNYIVDLAGNTDDLSRFFTKVDLIIVPTMGDLNSIKVTADSILQYKKFTDNILVVQMMGKDGVDLLESIIFDNFGEMPILSVRYSKIFDLSMRDLTDIWDFVDKKPLNKVVYKNVIDDVNIVSSAVRIITKGFGFKDEK